MSMDPMPVYLAAKRWKNATRIHLPRTQIEPVIWIDPEDRLAMYHPAMALKITTPPRAWDQNEFMAFVAKILPDACNIVEKHIVNSGVPGGFYGNFPEYARMGMSMEGF